ncbi:hypothetical protein, partial [Escherichia coli]
MVQLSSATNSTSES